MVLRKVEKLRHNDVVIIDGSRHFCAIEPCGLGDKSGWYKLMLSDGQRIELHGEDMVELSADSWHA